MCSGKRICLIRLKIVVALSSWRDAIMHDFVPRYSWLALEEEPVAAWVEASDTTEPAGKDPGK